MKTVTSHNNLSSPDIIYALIKNYQDDKHKIFIKNENLHKVNIFEASDYFENIGKMTKKFHIGFNCQIKTKKFRYLDFGAMLTYLVENKNLTLDYATNIINYLVALYANSNDNLKKEIYFRLKDSKVSMEYDETTELVPTDVREYILNLKSTNEDGSVPILKIKKNIEESTALYVKPENKNKLEALIEMNKVLYEEDKNISVLLNEISSLLGL